ncbi:hypothetical protein SAMN05660297_02936 [Natronincola peptidivorans]|uniref:Bacterial repeat domain-containing protein n=1 Tax=Natronincola peptidivorans TaxID=426128 RepID=A0A1I0FSZ3_9FIRM|nr:hypothetical protein [Natronincola peptidivorans]SET61552.1 hypothetical protein SAMN05660297_02936 [Natronincola peptidivorans]
MKQKKVKKILALLLTLAMMLSLQGCTSEEESSIYAVQLVANPTGGGWTDGTALYEPEDTVTIEAGAYEGYEFVNWTIDGVEFSDSSTYSFTMGREDINIAANFVDVAKDRGDETGYEVSIIGAPFSASAYIGEGFYEEGEMATVAICTNSLYEAYMFIGWSYTGNKEDIVELCDVWEFPMPDSQLTLYAHFMEKDNYYSGYDNEIDEIWSISWALKGNTVRSSNPVIEIDWVRDQDGNDILPMILANFDKEIHNIQVCYRTEDEGKPHTLAVFLRKDGFLELAKWDGAVVPITAEEAGEYLLSFTYKGIYSDNENKISIVN